MANFFPAQAKVHPSFSEPELILTYAQASGAFEALPEGKPRVKIGSEDLYVYINQLDVRTEALASQSPGNLLPSVSFAVNYNQTATYNIRVRATYDHHDMRQAALYNISLSNANDFAMRQGIYQQMRSGLLYGFQASNGEGLLNTVGATSVTLPADTYGNTTLSTYDAGQMAQWILGEIVSLKEGMYQSGGNIKNKIVIISPQRVFLQLSYASVVQVTSYQRPGAGTSTVAQEIAQIAQENGDEIMWYYDDTLIGKGAGGSDAVIVTIPEIEQPDVPGINTNEFANLQNNMKAVSLMYADMAAPMKIPTPVPDGAITEVQELRVTSGWGIRPQGIYILNIPH